MTSGLYYKTILMIVSDACTINVLLSLALSLASELVSSIMLINDATVMLESSLMIVKCLWYTSQCYYCDVINIIATLYNEMRLS